ncbi:MAG: efflux RND transporter periplasmic adaptor subunit [Microscillaceae bacterium]|nr:efflux RND transporter periplasmic adaptor subunit [Microscillaceae bacterium]MDW8460844.1 efflux RND transporter periplasmic adaptor subunit [Cytophagales bacterium]
MKNNKLSLLLLVICFFLTACGEKSIDSEGNGNYIVKGEVISLTANSNIKPRIKLEKVVLQDFRVEFTTAGTVKSIPNHYAEIAPPFAGRVLKSFVRLGQKVEPNSPIFEISSPDYFNAQKEYFDAKQEFRLAEQNLKRQQDLFKNGVGVQRELEEAETNFSTKKTALENAAAALRIFNVEPSQVILGQPLVVRSPIRGEIVDNKIVIGQYLKADSGPIAIVAELSKVWIAGQIKEKDIRYIHQLDEVEVKVAAFPDKVIKGKIYHLNEMVDESTRSVQLLIECDNSERILKPGMYVTVRFIDTPSPAILIPSKAILQMNDNQFVFVQVGKDQYQRRKIETEGTFDGKAIVRSGLKADEVIVSEGGIYLLEAK